MKKIESIQDIKDLILHIYTNKKKTPTELELSSKAVILIVKKIKDINVRKLMFVKACEFNGDNASTPDTLLKAMILKILFKKESTHFFVRKEEVMDLGYNGASSLIDAVRHVNKIISPILEIDFSEEPSHKEYLYFSFRNNMHFVSV